ncbi:MAG: cysteine desulfurase family protein [Patescibacteria group bacterium]|nr:cysteine desulfurase family protein [Patescibacteria group bacterium]
MKKIYLDHAATTPMDKKVLDEMIPYFIEKFGNPSSIHQCGQEAMEAVDKARKQVADFLGCNLSEIIFTSGATESNNMTIKGIIKASKVSNPHIITSAIEHPCIINSCKAADKEEGTETTYLKVDKDGIINLEDVRKAIRKNTILISILYANNEVGVIEPIAEIGEMLKEINLERENDKLPKIYFHIDAVQAINYLDCNVDNLGIDLLSLSGHKIYGPKGSGVLYIRQGTKIESTQNGGEQENNFRAGTHNVPGIVGLGKAISLVTENKNKINEIKKLRDYFIDKVLENITNSQLNGSKEFRLPHNANFSFKGVEGESLLMMLDAQGISVSTGSACSSASLEPSHVLTAMKIPPEVAHSSIRFTLGKDTTKEDIDYTLKVLIEKIERLREISGMR